MQGKRPMKSKRKTAGDAFGLRRRGRPPGTRNRAHGTLQHYDPVIFERLSKFHASTRPALADVVSAFWLGRVLAQSDGGPVVDAPRLGPALRRLGFRSVRRRNGKLQRLM